MVTQGTDPLFPDLTPPPASGSAVQTAAGGWRWARFAKDGYECSSLGDKRFSALYAVMPDGRTIESHFQLTVKGYGVFGTDWRLGKGKPPLDPSVDVWAGYLALWRTWAAAHPDLMADLATRARGKVLTDRFASSPNSQARALAHLLGELGYPSELVQ